MKRDFPKKLTHIQYDALTVKECEKVRQDNSLSKIYIKDRKCLRCEKSFTSFGYHNRMCVDCREVKISYFEDVDYDN